MCQKNAPAPAATPLPVRACLVVSLIQITEALNAAVLFPFVVFMIRDFGVAERGVGRWAGVVGAAFFVGQFFSSYHWGRAADAYGEKLALVLGITGTAASSVVFGFSSSLGMAIGARFANGLLNGNIGVMKSYITKKTDASNRSRAFALLPLGFGLGLVAAPTIGGTLSQPARRWALFDAPLWRSFPYLLPMLVCAGFQIVVLVVCACGLESDRPPSRYATVRESAQDETEDLKDDSDCGADEDVSRRDPPRALRSEKERSPVWRRRGPLLTCCGYALMAGAQMLLDEVFPLFARGCLGYGSSQIGTFLAASGAAVPVGALLSPYTIHRLGELRAFFIVNAASLVLGIAIPFVALGLPAETSTLVLYCCYFATRVAQTVGFTVIMILVNSSAHSSEMGAVNGFGQSLAAISRGAGPLIGGTLWSLALAEHRATSREAGSLCPRYFVLLPFGARALIVIAALLAIALFRQNQSAPGTKTNEPVVLEMPPLRVASATFSADPVANDHSPCLV